VHILDFLYFIYGHKVVIGRCRYFKSVSTVSVFQYTGRYSFKKSVRYFSGGVEATATATTSRRRGCRSVIDGRRRIKRGYAGRRDELCRCSKRTCTHDALTHESVKLIRMRIAERALGMDSQARVGCEL